MATNQRNSLFYNFSSLGIIQITNFLLSLIVIPHVIRIVGADGFGIIAVAQVIIFYLSAITDYGFNRTATRDIALNKSDTDKISKIFFIVLSTKIILCLLSFIILALLVLSVPFFYQHRQLYLLAFSFVLGQALLVNWFFQGFEKMQYMAVAGLFSRIIFVVLVLIFIREKKDNSLFLFFMGAGNVLAGLVSIYAAVRSYKLKYIKPAWKDIQHEIRNGWQVTVTNLSMITCQYIGLFILRLFTNDLLVGYYSIAEKIYFGMKLMLEVFSQTVYPRVCTLIRDGKQQVFFFFKKVYLPFLLLVTLACVVVFVFSAPIIQFFIGHEHQYSVFLLRLLCPAVILVCLNIPAHLILFAADHKRSYLKIFSIGTGLNVVLNLALVQYFDAAGTVVSVLLTELFITVFLSIEAYRHYVTGKLVHKAGTETGPIGW